MIAARAVPFTSGATFASSAFEAAADESPAVTKSSAKTPSAVSSMQPVQSPFGESEKIFAPHFRQILATLIIAQSHRVHFVLRKIWSHITRELQQSDDAVRLQYRRESQPCERFPRAIMIDSAAETDERPA